MRKSAIKDTARETTTELVIPKELLNLFSGSQKAKIDESGESYTGYGPPAELVEELERKGEKVDPSSPD
jgi:hypothetical protein